ncbi:MAG: ASKHA domain-containing protein [Lachnospiraceae bacterium]|nr:ASKHA domain-containing protein [Butyrivibrio sp.]MCM1345044.1 ASKHA domain-containing protein [Muribaculaceae bacterium]MCM1412209.1 ASKHA domain-containing protein [Lachnospiraceae bacterium]
MCKISGKGLRCQICTGCGLCFGVTPGNGGAAWENVGPGRLRVLTEDALRGEKVPFSRNGKRLAVADIGTTTIAMLLYDLDGGVAERFLEGNPQTIYGADVLSRIRAAEEPTAAAQMRKMLQNTLGKGLRKFQKKLSVGEELYLTVAANTTMTYLFMGWDTAELGRAPFEAGRLSGAETELEGVRCFVLPGFSAFVGGDILAGCQACGMAHREEMTLLIDLGTNGELLLGNRHGRIACATAAGPAFEGGANRGIWGADMVRFLAILRRRGILDETGLLAEPYFDRGIRIGNVHVTKESVRSVQLAKAAIAAGIEILLEKQGISEREVDRVVLAGGFGYYLDPADAAKIGLLPRGLADRTETGGNTALSGALQAGRELLSVGWESVRGKLEGYRRDTMIVNLAMEPGFEQKYIDRMELK